METKVLILEKDAEACNLLKAYMETKAYAVFCVDTLREAIWKAREVDPHVILVGQPAAATQAQAVAKLQQVSDSRIIAVQIADELLQHTPGRQDATAVPASPPPAESPRTGSIPVFRLADSNSSSAAHAPQARPPRPQHPAGGHPADKRPGAGSG